MVNFLSFFFFIATSFCSTTFQASSMFVYGSFPESTSKKAKDLYDTTPSYPQMGFASERKASQIIQNRDNKAMPPLKTQRLFQGGNISILAMKRNEYIDAQAGSAFFAQADIAQSFNKLCQTMQEKPYTIAFLRKIHINALNQLYHHLIGVYLNMILQSFGMQMTPQSKLQLSIPLYLKQEETYNMNLKMLIIDHLINIIESQFNSTIRRYAPKMPQSMASYTGRFAICNDYSVDLTRFIEQQVDADLAEEKKEFLEVLALDLAFFNTYTSYLDKPHPKHPQHFSAFVAIAQDLAERTKNKELDIQPSFFHFEYDDIAALKVIPYLARKLTAQTKSVPWPEQMVQAANEGAILSSPGQIEHPIAYFRNDQGRVVKNISGDTQDGRLYACLRSGQNLFEEEVINQPAWLNSWQGIIKILMACYGNLEALLDLDILDPCTTQLIEHGITTKQGGDANMQDTPALCKAFRQGPVIQTATTTDASIATQDQVTNSALTNILLNQTNG